MEDQIAEVLKSLGAEGLTAFYAYLAVDTLQLIFIVGMITWGLRSIWPTIKKDMKLD